MTSVLNYFGYNGNPTPPPEHEKPAKKAAVRALPAQWYTSREMYDLERRAIFSRRWLFITHSNRLREPGDFIRYTEAGYDFILTKDRNHKINALHNVCRHRAYPVVEKPEGKAKILACRYHGWSYALDGKLAKAPGYQDLDDYDKSKNGMFPIHVRIDSKGFIWVNLDAKETPEVPWEEDFEDVDNQERFEQFDFDEYDLDHTYELEGGYNWKILADNFNECYHCPTTHPDIPQFLNVDHIDVDTRGGHMEHDHASTPEQKAQGFNVNSTYYFPNVSMSVSPHWMMIQKFLPDGPNKSSMHYEVYRHRDANDEKFHQIADTYARVMAEDKVLCDRAQKNLNAGIFTCGEMHPKLERGPLFFQGHVRKVITEHFNREKVSGREIWPARPPIPDTINAGISREDMEICNGLACNVPKEGLVW